MKGFRQLPHVAICSAKNCGAMYEITSSTLGKLRATKLPCGHAIGHLVMSAAHIKGGHEAERMIDYLLSHDFIKAHAFEHIASLGGQLDDGMNVRVPEE